DHEQRGGVHLGGERGAVHIGYEGPGIERLAQLLHQELLFLRTDAVVVDPADEALHLRLVYLAVGLCGRDHRPQHEFLRAWGRQATRLLLELWSEVRG